MTRRAPLRPVGGVLALWAALAFALAPALGGCGSSGTTAPPPETVPVDLRGRASVEVVADDNQFTPASIIVDAGTEVTWRNTDTIVHDVRKAADAVDFGGEFGVALAEFGPGATYSFTFIRPGTYPYTCTIHTGMDGTVEVIARKRP